MDDNTGIRKKGIVIVDTREQSPALKKAADEVRFLGHPGPRGENWSFDCMVVTRAGQVLTYERKTTRDAIASMDKLERQSSYTTGIIVEWDIKGLKLTEEWEDPKFRLLVENVEKRLWRLSHRQPVVFTHDVDGTVRFLRYLAGKRDLVDVRVVSTAATGTVAADARVAAYAWDCGGVPTHALGQNRGAVYPREPGAGDQHFIDLPDGILLDGHMGRGILA